VSPHTVAEEGGMGADGRDRLMGMLRGHVANGETVRKEDIETFFAGLRRGGV
jgi:hypothetical protein